MILKCILHLLIKLDSTKMNKVLFILQKMYNLFNMKLIKSKIHRIIILVKWFKVRLEVQHLESKEEKTEIYNKNKLSIIIQSQVMILMKIKARLALLDLLVALHLDIIKDFLMSAILMSRNFKISRTILDTMKSKLKIIIKIKQDLIKKIKLNFTTQ